MNEKTIKTRFLVISDTRNLDLKHYHTSTSNDKAHNDSAVSHFPPADVLLHCGNLTDGGGLEYHEAIFAGLVKLPIELKLLIAGHRDIDLDSIHYRHDLHANNSDDRGSAEVLWRGKRAIDNGVHFLEEGTYVFVLKSGASFTIHASPYTARCDASAFQYPSHLDRFNGIHTTPPWATNISTRKSIIPAHIDILMTHGPPQFILDWHSNNDNPNGGCEHLRRAVLRAKPRLHCFGHMPSAWGVQRVAWRRTGSSDDKHDMMVFPSYLTDGKPSKIRGYAMLDPAIYEQLDTWEQTLFVNAAVGNNNGQMQNLPWLIELDLLRRNKEGEAAKPAGKKSRRHQDKKLRSLDAMARDSQHLHSS